jgi:hypothetical protein
MTSKEFVIWLKGFTEGVHEYSITPKQWDYLKEKLAEVKDDDTIGFPFGTPNSAPFVTLPHITPGPSTDPYNPYKITCSSGSFGTTTTNAKFPIEGSNVTYTTYQPYTTGLDKPKKLKKK